MDGHALSAILEDVAAERRRQDEKWGPSERRPVPSLSVLVEEVGEVAEAMQRNHVTDVVGELIQVAAVAVAMIEGAGRGDPPLR